MHQVHSVEPVRSEKSCILHCIVFDKVILDTINLNRYYISYIKPIIDGKIVFPTLIASDNKLCKILSGSLQTVIKEYNSKNVAYELLITLELERLVASIFRYHDFFKGTEEQSMSSSKKELMDLLFIYLKNNFQRKISLDEISDFLHINKFYFCRLVHNISGKSFTELLNIYRIDHAAKLIKSKPLSIYSIAEQSGFTNLSYFNRIFMKYTGCTPSSYRKSVKNDVI
jgi:YesN/AraC family two-component response regulator